MAELMLSRLISQGGANIYVNHSYDQSFLAFPTRKNTIVAISNTPISSAYICSSPIEYPQLGDVIVKVRSGDLLDFSSNTVDFSLSIIAVQQYTGEKWENIEAYLFNGVDWIKVSDIMVWLYNRGYREDELTGGWGIKLADGGAAAWNEDHFRLYKTNLDELLFAAAYTNQGIDVSSYTTLRVVMSIPSRETSSDDQGKYRIVIGLSPVVYTGYGTGQAEDACSASMSIAKTFSAEQMFDLDISELIGPHHLQLSHWGCDCRFYEIYLM
jgi:hypothetical protein